LYSVRLRFQKSKKRPNWGRGGGKKNERKKMWGKKKGTVQIPAQNVPPTKKIQADGQYGSEPQGTVLNKVEGDWSPLKLEMGGWGGKITTGS